MITAFTAASFCIKAIWPLKTSPISGLITLVPLESSRVRTAIAPSSSDSKWTVGSEGETENSFDFGICPQVNAVNRQRSGMKSNRKVRLLKLQIRPEYGKGALIVAKPIRVSSDTPVFCLELNDGHPYSGGIFRVMGLAFSEHDDFCEIQHEMLLGEPVKTAGEHAYFNAIIRIFVVRAAGAVAGVFSHFINPAHHLLARLGIVRNLFPKHEGISKLRHYGVLNIFCECATSYCEINPRHRLSSLLLGCDRHFLTHCCRQSS